MNRQILEFNGNYFESMLYGMLCREFPDASVMHDKSLYCKFLGKETQIDLILVHQRGVFVIEAKNWKEWIRGNAGDVYWSGKSQGRDTMKVFSPVDQNFLHIRTLKNAIRSLGYEPPQIYNVICVPDGTTIYSDYEYLCTYSMLKSLIKNLLRKSSERISVQEFFLLLQNAR